MTMFQKSSFVAIREYAKDDPALQALLEQLYMTLSAREVSQAEAVHEMLAFPATDARKRLHLFQHLLDDDATRDQMTRDLKIVIGETVTAAQQNDALQKTAEKIVLLACRTQKDKIQENAIDALEKIYASPEPSFDSDEPVKNYTSSPEYAHRLIGAYKTILETPENFSFHARQYVLQKAYALCETRPALKPEAKALTVQGLIDEDSRVQYVALGNMEGFALGLTPQKLHGGRWLINFAGPHYNEDDYLDGNGHLVNLASFTKDQIDELAKTYKIILDNPESFPETLKQPCVERSVDLVKYDTRYADDFTPTFIREAMSFLSSARHVGWDGLIAARFDLRTKRELFIENTKTVADQTYLEAALIVLSAKEEITEFGTGIQIDHEVKAANKELYNKQQQENRNNPQTPPTKGDIALKLFL